MSGGSIAMQDCNRFQGPTLSRGVSLIEVLVALLVFGIGVVGFAALQLKSVRQVEETYSRSQAMSVAHDFIERARSNLTDESRQFYLQSSNWTSNLSNPGSCVVTNSTPSADDGCDALAMAEFDVYEVRTSAAKVLQNGKISVATCQAVTCVTVAWGETQLDECDQSGFSNGERESDAHCVQLEVVL